MADQNVPTTAPVTSKGAPERPAANITRPPEAPPGASLPPPTPTTEVRTANPERTRRIQRQQAAKAQVLTEANIMPPRGEEKTRQIAEHKAADVARFGDTGTNRRKAVQAEHARQAEAEAVAFAVPAKQTGVVGALVPGTQPTALQLRQLTKLHQGRIKDQAQEAAVAAGRAVRDTLLNRNLRTSPHSRLRKINQAQRDMQTAQANAQDGQTGR